MKIAICISGAFRQVKKAYPLYVKHLLNPIVKAGHTADCYFASWDSKIPHFKMQIADDSSIEEVVAMYKPVKYSFKVYDEEKRFELHSRCMMDWFYKWIENQPETKRTNGRWAMHQICPKCKRNGQYGGKCRICGGDNVHNQIGMLFNVQEAMYLACMDLENDKHNDYDIYIRTRFDNIYQEDFPVHLLSVAGEKDIYIPSGDDDFPEYGGGCNDQFAFGRFSSMQYYCSQFSSLNEIAQNLFNTPGGYGIPHKSINYMAWKYNLDIVRFPFKYAIQKRLDGK